MAKSFEKRFEKSYRGIAGVALPPTVYAKGKVVRWAAFSSSSYDQGVGQAFSKGGEQEQAVVFTVWGYGGRDISKLSRLSRERELLYATNTLVLIESMLTKEQQQLLGKERLQLVEVRQVSEGEALDIAAASLTSDGWCPSG
eukprot:gene7924-19210_t